MNKLSIDCFLTEKQMNDIVKEVVKHISDSDIYGILDFDDIINGVRVSVRLVTYLSEIHISLSEILNNDWDLMESETAVFKQRLSYQIDSINEQNKQSIAQSMDITNDENY